MDPQTPNTVQQPSNQPVPEQNVQPPHHAPYGVFVALGVFIVILLIGYLFLVSTNSLKTVKQSVTIDISPAVTQVITQTVIDSEATESSQSEDTIIEELDTIDLDGLDKEMKDLNEDAKSL